MHVKIPHKFSRSEAVQRVKQAIDHGRSQMGDKATIDEERWEGDTLHFGFTAQGQHISGELQITDKEFELDAKLPLMMRLFEGKIEKMITEQAAQVFK